MISPFASTASVSPRPITIVAVPPLNSIVGVPADALFAVAFIPSSDAFIFIVPSFICIQVPSMPSAEVISNVPPSICTVVVPCIPSLAAFIVNVPPEM